MVTADSEDGVGGEGRVFRPLRSTRSPNNRRGVGREDVNSESVSVIFSVVGARGSGGGELLVGAALRPARIERGSGLATSVTPR